uniref:Putative rad21 protein a n=1 Tax=Corethrella appendiculata TaxID=1370023 RepID=U5EIC0_9DIPT
MFYAHIVLAKKGPLARIWLAAHWDKKITKAHVFETNIEQSVDGIMQPKVKLALRTSGHLLLGVVRIYSRKAKYLLADCNEAFVKIKMAFRPGMVDLPEEHREAAVNAITLPEVFHDFDTPLPELNDVDIEAQFSINQSRADEITMREDYGTLPINIHDDGFGDMGFDDAPDIVRDGIEPVMEDDLFTDTLGPPPDLEQTKEPIPGPSHRSVLDSLDPNQINDDDGFGDEQLIQPAAGLFEGDIFADAPLPAEPQPLPGSMTQRTEDSDDDDGHFDGGAPSPAPSTDNSRPGSPVMTPIMPDNVSSPAAAIMPLGEPIIPPLAVSPTHSIHPPEMSVEESALIPPAVPDHEEADINAEQTTLLQNEEESFALAPVDESALKGVTKSKRKRKLIVDEVKNISGEEMKSQLANTSDIVTTLDLAPPTKRLMYWKETGGVEKLFALPARDIPAKNMFKNYQRHLTSRSLGIEDFSVLGPADVLALDQYQTQNVEHVESPVAKRGKKRKQNQENIPPLLPPPTPLEQSIPDQIREGVVEQPQPLQGIELRDDICEDLAQTTFASDNLMPPPATPGMSFASPTHSMLGTPAMMPPTPGMNIPMTPGGLQHGLGPDGTTDFEPSELPSVVDDNLLHGGLTPHGLDHGGLTPHHGGLTPHHGGLTPHHGLGDIETLPNLQPDQVSSILNAPGMENFSNMGYDGPTSPGPRGIMSERIPNDWNEDYDFPPPSPAQAAQDEQLMDETIEQFEERVLNKRAAQLFLSVRGRLQRQEHMVLSDMTYRNNKKQAAQKFYSLLVLKKFQTLEIKQSEPYADIVITKGPMFENPKL